MCGIFELFLKGKAFENWSFNASKDEFRNSVPFKFSSLLFDSQVKQLMEEAVTKKFIHADSSSITSLCGKK